MGAVQDSCERLSGSGAAVVTILPTMVLFALARGARMALAPRHSQQFSVPAPGRSEASNPFRQDIVGCRERDANVVVW